MSIMVNYVDVPKELYPILGKPDEGTRIYRAEGPKEQTGDWYEALDKHAGPLVSPGGAGMYCPVSRAAVHKRIKEGKLSCFLYHSIISRTKLWSKKEKTLRDSPFGYVAVSELKQWRKEIEERAITQGKVTAEELEGSRPDWQGDYLDWPNKDERPDLKNFLGEMNMTLPEFLAEFPVDVVKAILNRKK
jgi:hypothetical protein